MAVGLSDSAAALLGPRVGHTVAVTGVVSHAKMHGMDKNATEHGHMTVTDLKMVSESCEDVR